VHPRLRLLTLLLLVFVPSAVEAQLEPPTTGGYAVPYIFDPTIIHTGAYTNINPYRQICRVEQIVGRPLPGQIIKAGPSTRKYPVPDSVAGRLKAS